MSIPAAWPLLLNKEQLCAYLGVCERTLSKICPVAPLDLGANVVRYDRRQIDAWVERLPARGLKVVERHEEPVAPAVNPRSALERIRARNSGENHARPIRPADKAA